MRTHKEKVISAYRNADKAAVRCGLPGQSEQADRVITSFAKIMNLDLNACNEQQYQELLSMYLDMVICRDVVGMADASIADCLQMNYPMITNTDTAKKLVGFYKLSASDSEFSLDSREKQDLFLESWQSVGISGNGVHRQYTREQLKKIAAEHLQHKREKRKQSWRVVGFIFLGIALVFGFFVAKHAIEEAKPYRPFSEDARPKSKAYVDAVSIEPVYGVTSATTSIVQYVLCKCETADGAVVWISIRPSEYEENFGNLENLSTVYPEHNVQSFDSPRRIYGIVKLTKDYARRIPAGISNKVIEFDSVEQ